MDILESDGEDSDVEVSVYLQPPDGDLSDGFSGSEDEGDKDPNRLSARVLQAPAELRRRKDRLGDVGTEEEREDERAAMRVGEQTATTSARGRSRARGRGGGGSSSVPAKKWEWKRPQSVRPRGKKIFPPPFFAVAAGKILLFEV